MRLAPETSRLRGVIPPTNGFEGAASRPGHRPILEQALGAGRRPIAGERLDPWAYGGQEPPAPRLDGRGSRLLTTIRGGRDGFSCASRRPASAGSDNSAGDSS